MSENKKAPLFGKKVETEKETVIPEVKVTETPMITMSIDELNALIDSKLNAAKTPEVKQERVVSKEEKTIRNHMSDDIPELRDFPVRERIYVLCDGSKPEAREIKSRHKPGSPLQYFNRETNESHALFFSMTQASFYKTEHKGDSKVDHIFMKDGMLTTYPEDVKLQSFLEIHPDNEKNGGSLFMEYLPGKEAENDLESEDLLFAAQKLARELSFIRQDAVARLLCKNYKESWEPAEMKLALFNEVKRSAKEFMKLANDPRLEIKGIARTAVQRGFIEYKGYKFWNDQGEVIVDVPRNSNEYEVLADYFLSNQGRNYYEYLVNSIN